MSVWVMSSYSDIIICFSNDVMFSSKTYVLFISLGYNYLPQRHTIFCLPKLCLFAFITYYVCLQHMRFHMDTVALTYSFYEVISATESAPRPLRELRHRCLNPGQYVHHLERWLTYYKPKQVRLLSILLSLLHLTLGTVFFKNSIFF